MGQIKIYALKETIIAYREPLSQAIHTSIINAFQYPKEKKFQRFIELEKENFIYPNNKSENYIIIEISLFEGRTIETKKKLIYELYQNIHLSTQISKNDIEITLFETPKSNWGIRGFTGDELTLNYTVNL